MDKYVFKPYSKIFPHLFDREKERLAGRVNPAWAIEHVGSTAVVGLGGKGIIDIAIAVDRGDWKSAKGQLQSLGYDFRATGSTDDRWFFRMDLPDPEEGMRRYHVHLTYPESADWKGLIGFRDYLRSHPDDARRYAEMKKRAVIEANCDGKKYRQLKEPMFKEVGLFICSN